MTEVKKQQSRSRVFDQFLLMEQLGSCALSSMAGSIFRNLLNHNGTMAEGTLAANVGCRLFRPEWKPLIERLAEMGYVSFKSTGHAISRTVNLTENGLAFLADKEIIAEVEEPTEVCDDQKATG